MITLNFQNVEKLIFHDRELQKLLPDHMFSYFEQWRMGQYIPYLKQVGKSAILDFLNNVSEDEVQIIEDYFQEKVMIERLNYKMSFNLEIPLEDSENICKSLCEIDGNFYFNTWRDSEKLYIIFWR